MSDFTEVFSRVSEIKKRAERILSLSAKMESRPNLELDHDNEVFLLAELETAIDTLVDVQKQMSYLSRPIQEISRLWKNGSGQYETTRGYCFRAGSPIEALVPGRMAHSPCWVRTRLEYDGRDYYLEGYPHIPLKELTVRVREGDQP